jgi:glycosyltransferase involved in cell wall biosynthesis
MSTAEASAGTSYETPGASASAGAGGARLSDGSLRRRVLVVQPYLGPPGGGNGLVAWILQALQEEHEVTVLTWKPVSLAVVNRYFGTRLDPARIRVRSVPRLVYALLPNGPLSLLQHNLLLRWCKRVAARYDVVLSGNNESDFGRPGIQYVHYPRFDDPRVNPASPRVGDFSHLGSLRASPAVMRSYFALCGALSRFSLEGVRRNLTLVNSDWTGARVKLIHGVDSRTVYPPVTGNAAELPWPQRENGFVCLGRLAPEKRCERVVEILSRVRQRGFDVHLHIVGTPDGNRYAERIRRLAELHCPWVRIEESPTRAELNELVGSHRYGIHGMENEHFGMAVAEMVKAGCIVFAPNSGGPVEIVGGEARLLYDGDDDAVDKIAACLAERSRQEELRVHLQACGARFGVERFMDEIRAVVAAAAS